MALQQLERLKHRYGVGCAEAKLALLAALERTRLRSAKEVGRLHEALLFLRAYPDDRRVLARVSRMLACFARRADLRAHRDDLEGSGIAGTRIRYPFYWPTARWLAARWPKQLRLDRLDRAADRAIGRLLGARSGFRALDRIRQRGEPDAAHFVRLVERMPGSDREKEAFYDAIEPVLELRAGPGTPDRTLASCPAGPVVFQRAPLDRSRPDLRAEIRRAPRRVRRLARNEGMKLISLARGAMVTRGRDLDAFAYGDPGDVRWIDDGEALAFALVGMVAERRTADPAMYGVMTLRNGVPIGYLDLGVSGRHVEVAFNTFPAFRGAEAARTLARVLAMLRHVFGARSFGVDGYQLGVGNREAIDSGAWWFYFKLGFRPRAAAARRLARRELARWRADPGYRSSAATLERLARWPLYYRYH
jgi:hypothetical protein